ncbi:DUF6011 domain-containing protein [Streptomyces yangpuensis]|uniref:DUF6011 domain-containing protein n=1 Tax=Streptomyces yangpuensis TaxID=1648182 RepID=UPI00365D581D
MAHAPEHQTSLPIALTRQRPLVRCLDCGAPLTDAESRRWARGPNCRSGIASGPVPGRFNVEQGALPDTE